MRPQLGLGDRSPWSRLPGLRSGGKAEAPGQLLRRWDAQSGLETQWASVDADSIDGLSVSPDGRSIVYGLTRESSNLMLIQNFR